MSASSLLYWAQPIDYTKEMSPEAQEGLTDFLSRVHNAMREIGFTIYNPHLAFSVGCGEPSSYVSIINQTALDEASVMFAYLPANVVTYGVPMEIEAARQNDTPVVIATDQADSSWTVAGWADDPNILIVTPNSRYVQGVADWVAKVIRARDSYRSVLRDRILSLDPASHQSDLVFQAYDPNAKLPSRGHDDDAGYDLYTLEDTVIPPGEFVDVPTGVAVDLPDGLWGMITGRSSTLRLRKLLVSTGIIDNGYTGVLFAGCQNLSTEPVTVKAGERVAQIILLPTSALGFKATWGSTRDKARGANGFGSTGR